MFLLYEARIGCFDRPVEVGSVFDRSPLLERAVGARSGEELFDRLRREGRLLRHARANRYAVGYFEAWNLESILAVKDAAEDALLALQDEALRGPARRVAFPRELGEETLGTLEQLERGDRHHVTAAGISG